MEAYINEGVRVWIGVFQLKNEMISFYTKWNGFDILFDVYCTFVPSHYFFHRLKVLQPFLNNKGHIESQ